MKLTKHNRGNDIDLSFLPEAAVDRITDIFDSYKNTKVIPSVAKPSGAPEFPNKVSGVDLNELRDYHSQFESWLGYTKDRLKFFKVVKTVVSDLMDDAYNKRMADLKDAKGNIEGKKAHARIGKEYLNLKAIYIKAEALEEMLYNETTRLESHVMSLRAELKSRELNSNF